MKKMNNKGFSLVELIIVIAIMAILIVVLAPQYLKYVEKSRNSTDLQNAVELKTAIEVYASDPDSVEAFPNGEKFMFTVTSTGTTVTGDAQAVKAADAALAEAALDKAGIKCSSKTAWQQYTMEATAKPDGSFSWVYTNTDFSNAFTNTKPAAGGGTP